MSVAVLTLAGCATLPERPPVAYTGDPVLDGNAELAAAPKRDRVLWNYRIAASALRADNYDEAKSRLDEAILTMGGIIANDADAARARSLFAAEREKIFIGEPYERVMAYYYRGILYWRDGEPDNARACFRSGQFIDSSAEGESYRSDYVLLDYLDGLASVKLDSDGSDALARARKNYPPAPLPPYDPQANVLVFAEFGRGPRKYAGGQFGEELHFQTADARVHSAVLNVAGQTVRLPAYDDLDYQATTRGGRVMDHILGGKAVFKQGADTVGNVALTGAAVAAQGIRRADGRKSHNTENVAIALGVIGLLGKVASAATMPQADTRTWDNLPQRLSFAALRLPPGTHEATLQYLDANGRRIPGAARQLAINVDDPARDTVVFLSELKR